MSHQVGVGRSTLSLIKKVSHPGSYEQSLEIHSGPHRSMRRLIIGSVSRLKGSMWEVLGDHRRQSQQSRLELGLRLSDWFGSENDLDC